MIESGLIWSAGQGVRRRVRDVEGAIYPRLPEGQSKSVRPSH